MFVFSFWGVEGRQVGREGAGTWQRVSECILLVRIYSGLEGGLRNNCSGRERWVKTTQSIFIPSLYSCHHSEITPLSLTHKGMKHWKEKSCLITAQQNKCASSSLSLQERRCLGGHPEQPGGKADSVLLPIPILLSVPFFFLPHCFLLGNIKII